MTLAQEVLDKNALLASMVQHKSSDVPPPGHTHPTRVPLMAVSYHIRVLNSIDGCPISYACPQGL